MAGLRKIKIKISDASWCCNQDLNQAPLKYKSKALPLYKLASLTIVLKPAHD